MTASLFGTVITRPTGVKEGKGGEWRESRDRGVYIQIRHLPYHFIHLHPTTTHTTTTMSHSSTASTSSLLQQHRPQSLNPIPLPSPSTFEPLQVEQEISTLLESHETTRLAASTSRSMCRSSNAMASSSRSYTHSHIDSATASSAPRRIHDAYDTVVRQASSHNGSRHGEINNPVHREWIIPLSEATRYRGRPLIHQQLHPFLYLALLVHHTR
jgi:hypothetical protein